MKQTAVEWLWDMLSKGEFINDPKELFNQAKAMEKRYIVKSCMLTMETCDSEMNKLECKTMDDYFNFIYNKTFKSE